MIIPSLNFLESWNPPLQDVELQCNWTPRPHQARVWTCCPAKCASDKDWRNVISDNWWWLDNKIYEEWHIDKNLSLASQAPLDAMIEWTNGKMSPGGQAWVSKEVEEIHALAPPFQICLFHFNNNYKIEVEASLSPPLLVPDYCLLLQVTKENGSSGKRPNYKTSIWCLCHNNLVLLIKVH